MTFQMFNTAMIFLAITQGLQLGALIILMFDQTTGRRQ